jgi:hypothetical protein
LLPVSTSQHEWLSAALTPARRITRIATDSIFCILGTGSTMRGKGAFCDFSGSHQ